MHPAEYGIEFEPTDSYLVARATGVRTRENVTSLTLEIFERALAEGYSRVLVDASSLKGRLGMADSYLVVTSVFAQIRGKGINKAAILDVEVSSAQQRFMEIVARNRGFNFRIFSDREQAALWLQKD